MNLKLPHFVQLGVALALLITTWVVQQTTSGALVLPAAAMSVLVTAQAILGLFSLPVGSPTVVAKRAALAASRAVASCFLLALLVVALGCSSCTKAQGVAVQNAVASFTSDETVCILNHDSLPPDQIAVTCGLVGIPDVAAGIVSIIEAQRAAEIRDLAAVADAGAK